MSTPILVPLHIEGMTRATIRVCIRLIQFDHKRYPENYSYKPSGILSLADARRREFPELYGSLVYIAKAVAEGWTLAQLRHAPVEYTVRSIAKRRPRR